MRSLIRSDSLIGIPFVALLAISTSAGAQDTFSAPASGTWTPTGSLTYARDGHTATLLKNGNVLVTGGENDNITLGSSELYNPSTGKWTATGFLHIDRAGARAVLLPSGQVLVAGGCTSNCLDATNTAELYNPTNGAWSLTGGLATGRAYFSLTLLKNGHVLAAGGCTALDVNGCTTITNTAEIYNPSTGSWTPTGHLRAARTDHTASLIGAAVLVAGGANSAGDAFSSSELYNPTTGLWTLTGRMNAAHAEHTATVVSSGKVLVAGGENAGGVSGRQTELYDPATGKWTLTGNLHTARQEHTAVLLPNGNVLVAGGTLAVSTGSSVLRSSEIYNPSTGLWTTSGAMKNARTGHTATLLTTGVVLAAAGSGATADLVSAEIYTP
jgi:N-acetylneuraminic acid mutarotase